MNIKEIENVINDANKYRNMKERYVEYAKTIRDLEKDMVSIGTELKKIAEQLDPKILVGEKRKSPDLLKYDEACADLTEKMMAGTFVTTEMIKATFPSLNTYAVWNRLKKRPDVDTGRSDGSNKHLFMKRG